MNHCDALTITRNEIGVSKHIPITHLVSDTIVETKNGDLISLIKVNGMPFHTEENHRLNYFHRIWHSYICSLDERFGVYVTSRRERVNHNLSGVFSNSVLSTINEKYSQSFDNKGMFQNTHYIALIYRGVHSGKTGKSVSFLQSLSERFIKDSRKQFRELAIAELSAVMNRALSLLSEFKPKQLGNFDDKFSELLQYFSLLINLSSAHPVPRHVLVTRLEKQVSAKKKSPFKPHQNLQTFIPNKRYFFGECIQLSGVNKDEDRYALILSIKGYPEESFSLLLNSLLQINCEWISTHSFLTESNELALKRIKQHSAKLSNVNDAAVSQRQQLESLPDLIQSNQVKMGYHHHTLLLMAKTPAELDGYLQKATKCYLEAGFSVMKESIGQEPAYWSQIPGNHKYIARSSLITSENFSDFCPLHNYEIGYRDSNHLGSAVTLLQTASRTPYFFNFHRKGSAAQITPGHTVIIGSNGSGKTVLMTFLDAQLSRYQGCSIFFDRNRGVEIYIRASGGKYSVLSPNHPESTCFNPLLLPDSPGNRQFIYQWLAQLCKDNVDTVISAESYEQLKMCVDYAFEHLDPNYRSLSTLVRLLGIDFEHWPQLRRWLCGTDEYDAGEYAYIFDNTEDVLAGANKVGFDMTHFLDHEPPEVRTAVMMYLFHWIKEQMNGSLVAIYLDEAWQYFEDEYWVMELKRSIPTYRKLNAFLVMATQSAASVVDTKISHVIMDNCATQIFFPNPEAKQHYYCDCFNLTESEFQFIKNNEVNSRLFLVKQDSSSVICRLDLSEMQDEMFVLSGSEKSVRVLDKLRESIGDDPSKWLPVFLGEVKE
jgi:type IV secretion system protein VirB4